LITKTNWRRCINNPHGFKLNLKQRKIHSEDQRKIEIRFEELFQALQKRKDSLLGEHAKQYNFNRMLSPLFFRSLPLPFVVYSKLSGNQTQEALLKLKKAIEGCKNILRIGEQTFNENRTVAVSVWKVCVLFFKGNLQPTGSN
jgi:hypothetical protein